MNETHTIKLQDGINERRGGGGYMGVREEMEKGGGEGRRKREEVEGGDHSTSSTHIHTHSTPTVHLLPLLIFLEQYKASYDVTRYEVQITEHCVKRLCSVLHGQ